MELIKATNRDLPRIMDLIQQAKTFLKSSGVDQWQNGYPDQARIEKDLENETGFLFVSNGQRIGYLCIDFDGEPAYEELDGEWISIQPYVVVHRLALDDTVKGKGLASQVFRLVEELGREHKVHSFKVDTDDGNQIMKHLLIKNGFQYCGTISFDNSEKIAFEKLI